MKNLATYFFCSMMLMMVGSIHAADQDDIFVELGAGTHVKYSSQIITDASIGYLPVDNIGGGIFFGQVFDSTGQSQEYAGSLIGLEGRWFLEPFEVSLVLGRFVKSDESLNFLQASSNYLYALTPALAAKLDAKARLNIGDEWVLSLGVGARLLF